MNTSTSLSSTVNECNTISRAVHTNLLTARENEKLEKVLQLAGYTKNAQSTVRKVYVLYCTALHCTALHSTALYSTVLYCTVQYSYYTMTRVKRLGTLIITVDVRLKCKEVQRNLIDKLHIIWVSADMINVKPTPVYQTHAGAWLGVSPLPLPLPPPPRKKTLIPSIISLITKVTKTTSNKQ